MPGGVGQPLLGDPVQDEFGGRVERGQTGRDARHTQGVLHTTDPGLVAERVELPAGSFWDGRVVGDTRMRTETGVSIVAVLRRAVAWPSPSPDFRLAGGDTLVVIGTREGVAVAAALLRRS
ncbi:cation:proton antiporter regulatory subunit [Streptomyces sp. NPDC090022]|uniref:cation:proton antiporter regulatory subunit n=1 Tax=Streptomyces sp. NPDC090022 TaxID=3365920 RepID=UPI003814CDE9